MTTPLWRPARVHPKLSLVCALLVTVSPVVVACSTTSTSTTTTTVTVFAASSLQKSFTTMGQQFEASHRGTRIRLSFAGSADLVSQITQGSPADVFASADTKNMAKVVAAGRASNSTLFAANTLEIAVPPDNPAGISSLGDLTRPRTRLVVCAPAVPCGAATQKIASASGLALTPVSEESSVVDVLGKVQAGEADAGLVYVTDVRAAGDKVKGITFPESSQAVNQYPIAVVAGAGEPAGAQQFVDFVLGPQGQRVLADAGFAKP